jgi:hypothetical protein
MTYQIEKGVPIPEPITGKGTTRPQTIMGVLRSMDVGDSTVIDRAQDRLGGSSKLFPMKFTTRKVSENQTRIWRVA